MAMRKHQRPKFQSHRGNAFFLFLHRCSIAGWDGPSCTVPILISEQYNCIQAYAVLLLHLWTWICIDNDIHTYKIKTRTLSILIVRNIIVGISAHTWLSAAQQETCVIENHRIGSSLAVLNHPHAYANRPCRTSGKSQSDLVVGESFLVKTHAQLNLVP